MVECLQWLAGLPQYPLSSRKNFQDYNPTNEHNGEVISTETEP
jgi:hypothetical protein